MAALVECVPNFSEGRDETVIDRIAAAMDELVRARRAGDPGRGLRNLRTAVGAENDLRVVFR